MKKNNFSKNEKDWNVAQSKNMKVEAKRKASSEKTTDDDKEPLSSKNSVNFSFSKDDIEGSTKTATKSENNGREPKSKKQSDIYRFLAANANFKVRKKLKLK